MKDKDLNYLVFAEGFIVLALQIISSVLLTPYWGATFMFWTLELFFVMLALSAGYYFLPSIKAIASKDPAAKLKKVVLWLYFYILGLFVLHDIVLVFFISYIGSPVIGTAISLFFFIFIPVFLAGSIPVLVIAVKSSSGKTESEKAGMVFSISSLSGIISVVVLAFFSLPYLRLSYSLVLVLVALAWPLLILLHTGKNKKTTYLVIAAFFIGAAVLLSSEKKEGSKAQNNLVRVTEVQNGILGQLKVVENKSLKTKSLFVNNSLQSKTHLSGRSLYPYVYSLLMYSRVQPSGSRVLLAGMGAGSLVYEYSNLGYSVDVVDIDGRLPGLVERNFLVPAQKTNFIESDIRHFIKTNKKTYDVIVLDLSKGESVPTNVYTVECFRECRRSLSMNGVILIHFLSSLTPNGTTALASILKTLKEAGYTCELMNYRNQKSITDGVSDLTKPQGFILVAGDKIDLSKTDFHIDSSLMPELMPQKDHLFLAFDAGKGIVLTDDKPLLDLLQMDNAYTMRRQNIKALLELNKYAK